MRHPALDVGVPSTSGQAAEDNDRGLPSLQSSWADHFSARPEEDPEAFCLEGALIGPHEGCLDLPRFQVLCHS